MKISSADKLLEKLEKFRPNTNPKAEDLEKSDYHFYVLAPYWLPHQAVCLLAGIATIDIETFETILLLNELQLKMNKFFLISSKKKEKKEEEEDSNANGSISFSDYVIRNFPIPHKKLYYLKNLCQKINEAIKESSLESKKVGNELYIAPKKVLEWAKHEKIRILPELVKAMSKCLVIPFLKINY